MALQYWFAHEGIENPSTNSDTIEFTFLFFFNPYELKFGLKINKI